MRRGHYLESRLNEILSYLNDNGIHAHKNHAARTAAGAYLAGEPFDYEIMVSPPHCFDAKESRRDPWPLANAKPAQVRHLLNCRNHGAEAYFLVLFGGTALRRFDVADVLSALQEGRRSLHLCEGREWDWQQFLTS